ncbi:MAG: signal peptidase I [Candidatus Methylomirabilis oxyfera]|nr:signal peptidase I [Candidatus Methylomirabilis oxyfera]
MAEGFFVNLTANLLREGYGVRCRTYGMSMYPTIEDGDKVVVEPVAPSQIKRGDIILYRRHEGMIAHRVVRIARTEQQGRSPQHCFILRGDASGSCDEPVESERILGKVVAVEQCDRSIALDGMGAKISHILRSYGSRFKRWLAPLATSLLVLVCLA